MTSAAFTVNSATNPAAHSVSYGSTVNLQLLSFSGATSIIWTVQSCSHPGDSLPTITISGTPPGSTASFVMPADPLDGYGRTFLVKCSVSSDIIGSDGAIQLSEEFAVIGVPNVRGLIPIAPGEENYRDGTHGWGPEVNIALANTSTSVADVVGPASSTADRIAVFNGTGGKTIKDGGKTIAELLVGSVGTGSAPQAAILIDSTSDSHSGLAARDGVTPIDGTVIYDIANATSASRGYWLAHSGSWTRPAYYDSDADVASLIGSVVYILPGGTTHEKSSWQQVTGVTLSGAKTFQQILGDPDVSIGENGTITEISLDEGTGTGRARLGSRTRKDISTTIAAAGTATVWDWDGAAVGMSAGDVEIFAPNVIAKWSADSKYEWAAKCALVSHGSPPTIIEQRSTVALDGSAGSNNWLTLLWDLSGDILRLRVTNNRGSACSIRVHTNLGAFE